MNTEMLKTLARATIPRELRNWLRSPSKSAQWLLDSARYSFGMTKTLSLPGEWSIVCHPASYRVYSQAQLSDPEQALEFRNFLSFCDSSMQLFDIGASFGVFSLAAARFGGKAVAIDPSPIAARMIMLQAGLNNCGERIQVVLATVSDTNGIIGVLSSGVFSNFYLKVVKGRSKTELTPTQAITVDQITRQFGGPTHIKIDVEGHEAAVLRGAVNTIRQFSPLLFLELHNEMIVSEGGDPTCVLHLLAQSGYRTFALNGDTISNTSILSQPLVRLVAQHAECRSQ